MTPPVPAAPTTPGTRQPSQYPLVRAGLLGAVALGLLVVALANLAAYRTTRNLMRTMEEIGVYRRGLVELNHLLGLMRGLERYQLGFLLTGRDQDQLACQQAIRDLEPSLSTLRQTLGGLPTAAEALDSLELLVRTRAHQINQTLARGTPPGGSAGMALGQATIGGTSLDAIGRRALTLERTARIELDARVATADRQRRMDLGILGLVTVLAIALLGASGWAAWRGLRRQAQAQAELAAERGLLSKEVKATEAALAAKEQTLRTLVRASPVAIIALDRENTVTFWSPSAERMFGWREQEVVGHPFPLLPARTDAETRGYLELLQGGQSVYDVETRRVRKDGALLDVSLSAAPLRDQGGEVLGVIVVYSDITERKSLEQQLQQAQKMEAVGRLAGGIAHDFNNLITAISGFAELAEADLDETDSRRADLREVRKAAERAAVLTRQLLAFSRRQVLQREVLDLNAVVTDIETMLRHLVGRKIELVVVPNPAIGRVRADPSQIQQVLVNLTINAKDAMPDGGRLLIELAEVDLDEAYALRHLDVAAGRYIRLAVTDTGHGMSPEVQARLFEPFFTTKERGKGTGLGLSTCYGIVKQSGGSIEVYSEPGEGTSFKIYLPRVEAPAAVAPAPAAEVTRPLARGGETILVVEDQDGVRELTHRMLSGAGYRTLLAASGEEALRLFETDPRGVHLLLSDVMLPGISGPELAEVLRRSRPDLKIIYMSGYTEHAAMLQRMFESRAATFVEKPFTSATLLQRIRTTLDVPPATGRVEPPPG
jgi:PAS domain S-box-containing protein